MIGVLPDIIPASRVRDFQPKRWSILMCDPVTGAVECISLIENEQVEVSPFGCEPAPDIQRRNARVGAMEELRSTAVLDRERYRLERAAIEVLRTGHHAIAIRANRIGVPLGRGNPQNVRFMWSSFAISVHRVSARQSMPRVAIVHRNRELGYGRSTNTASTMRGRRGCRC